MNFRELLNKLDEVDAAGLDAATAPAGTAPAPADPAKQAAYRRAQAAMANLEKAAQYSGTDEIVRQRAGLPPPLPPIDQWDGKMPAPTGRPDWFNRWFGKGGGATGDVEKDQAAAAAQNTADASTIATAQEQLKQLADLVSKLGVKESKLLSANQLVESFGYQLNEFGADDAAVAGGAYAAGNTIEKKLAGDAAKGAAKAATGALGKMASKVLPGVGAAFGAADAYNRAKQGDYLGAGIAGLSGALSLVPGIGWMPAVALDMFNLGRDLRGPTASPAKAEQHPVAGGSIAQLQKLIGTEPDGIFGPKSQAALKVWQQKNGLEADGIPGPKTFAAAKLAAPGASTTVAEQISRLQSRIEEAQNPSPLYFILEDGNLYELTPEDEWYVLDEGLAGDAISGLAKYGSKAWDAVKGLGKGAAYGVKNPETAKLIKGSKPGATLTQKATTTGAKAGGVLARNPVKTTLGAGALGYALGNNSGVGSTTTTGGGGVGGSTGGQGGADTGTTTETPTYDPAVIAQIGELMSAISQVNDPDIQAELDKIRAQINKITGGKPLDSLIANPSNATADTTKGPNMNQVNDPKAAAAATAGGAAGAVKNTTAPAKKELTPQQQAQNVLQPGMNK